MGALKGCGQREDGSDLDFKLIILNYFTEEKQKSQAKVTNWESNIDICTLLLLLSCFSRVRLCERVESRGKRDHGARDQAGKA